MLGVGGPWRSRILVSPALKALAVGKLLTAKLRLSLLGLRLLSLRVQLVPQSMVLVAVSNVSILLLESMCNLR